MEPANTAYVEIQRRVESSCADARRLATVATQEDLRLRDARRQRAALERERGDVALADPRVLVQAKLEAQQQYRERVEKAAQPADVVASASAWLAEIDRLNRAAQAAGQNESVARQVREADAQVERLELSAQAARVAAATARQACLEARRALAGHDEAFAGEPSGIGRDGADDLPAAIGTTPIEALLEGDLGAVAGLVGPLSEEVGLDSSRMQLLLLELREAIVARAFESAVLTFPADHPFWSQFTRNEARALAASLGVLGRGFDGHGGWQGGQAAEVRELAIALSLAGRDPRTVKYRPTRAELDNLWQGTTVAAAEHLREQAPDLGLESMAALLGARAESLSDLWDNWGRLRRLLLSTPSAAGSG